MAEPLDDLQLVSEITVRPVQKAGGDEMVVAAAKVSTSGEGALAFADPSCAESNAGLIAFLMKHRHGTPFEHGMLTFFVHAPIFVFREWHRHRIASYNEESARYKPLAPVFWVPRRDRPLVPGPTHKSARPSFVRLEDDSAYQALLTRMEFVYHAAYTAYAHSMEAGIAKEVARAVLPVGIYSSCWVTVNPRSLMTFLSLRTRDDTARFPSYPQAEIEEAARACEAVFREGWPLTWRAWHENGRVAP